MKRGRHDRKRILRRVLYFFPFQLILLHIKRNHFLLLLWALLFGIVLGDLGERFGIPNLFLYPEYLGSVGPWAFAILGFSVGGFSTAFHLYSYVAHSRKFPFIATLSRPFLKFSINNSVIPTLFALLHILRIVQHQSRIELEESETILLNVGGYVLGGVAFFLLAFFYFFRTNLDLYKLIRKSEKKGKKKKTRFGKQKPWYGWDRTGSWQVETYLSTPYSIRLARGSEHYEEGLLERVFAQNHLNASIFELVVIVSFFMIGFFREYSFFMIPAGATIFLLFTMILMVASAIHSWVKGWSLTLIIGLGILFNFLSLNTDLFQIETRAYGMDHEKEPVPYRSDSLRKWRADEERKTRDRKRTLEMLENWKRKQGAEGGKKPKMLFLNVSGGGLRSALWTVNSLQHLDSIIEGGIFERTALITGSSGGMLGAAYLREIELRAQKDAKYSLKDPVHRERISNDLLNPVAFSIVTNDIFIRYQEHEYGGDHYKKDRAYSFEKQLNENTNGVLDKELQAYREPVRKARIPMMILSPTVVNDGRRLLISSQASSYLMDNLPEASSGNEPLVENVGLHRMFGEHGADQLRFLSALRMNATFPYILPTTSLPSDPSMEVMDAGLRDNFGFRSSIQFLYQFRDWIEKNTSGVVFLQIRDKERRFGTGKARESSLLQRMTRPVGSLYENVFRIQDHEQSFHFQQANSWFDGELDIVEMELKHTPKDRISLSLHLTALEKRRILEAIDLEENQKAVERLKWILDDPPP